LRSGSIPPPKKKAPGGGLGPTPQIPWGRRPGWHIRVLPRPVAACSALSKLANGPSTLSAPGQAVSAMGPLHSSAGSGWRAAALPGGMGEGHSSTGPACSDQRSAGPPLRPDQSEHGIVPFMAAAAWVGHAAPLTDRGNGNPAPIDKRAPRPSKAAARRCLKESAWKGRWSWSGLSRSR